MPHFSALQFLTKKNLTQYGVALLLLLPFFCLNVRSSFHWGDDFAVYVKQAINISEGKNFYETTYQFVPGFSSLPPVAPVGFSLLLAPVYSVFGVNPYVLALLMSVLFVLWALVACYFFRKEFGFSTSLVILLFAFYPNFMLWLKLLITSDILFCIFFLLTILFLTRGEITKHRNYLIAGIFGGLAIITRNVGWILIPAVWFYYMYSTLINLKVSSQNKISNPCLVNTLVFTIAAVTLPVIFNQFLFKTPIDYVSDTARLFSLGMVFGTVKSNVIHYGKSFLSLYQSTDPSLKTFSAIFSGFVLLLTIAGACMKIYHNADLGDFICGCYLTFILCFPVISDYRYIVPVHVILVLYFFFGARVFLSRLSKVLIPASKVVFLILMLLVFKDHLQYLWEHGRETVPGPYEEIVQETFQYLRTAVPDSELIVFNKPRALALYTNKKTTMQNWDKSPEENFNYLHALGAKYYLYSWMVKDENFAEVIEGNRKNFREVYKNWQFTLFKDTTFTENR